MFDIGFWELMLIAIIALVVLGPERLPVAIRTVRDWINNIRQFSNSVKTELKEELRINELHTNLKIAEKANMENLSPEVAESVKTLKEAAEMVNRPYQKGGFSAPDLNAKPIDINEKNGSTAAEIKEIPNQLDQKK